MFRTPYVKRLELRILTLEAEIEVLNRTLMERTVPALERATAALNEARTLLETERLNLGEHL